MQVPSGRDFDSYDVRFVQLAVRCGFIRGDREPIFGTRAGAMTRVYVGGREDLTEHPKLEWLVGRIIAGRILEDAHSREDLRQQCLIGIPTAGTPLAQAAAMASYRLQEDNAPPRIIHHVMRESLKTHGIHHGWMNGKSDSNHTYWLVDNTVGPSADSKFIARARLQESRYPINDVRALVLVDRQEGGIERMKQEGFHHIVVIYKILDILAIIDFLGLWQKDMVRAIEEEIQSHQMVA